MPDAAQDPAQPELPSPYQAGKRRGRARRTHTVAKVLLATVLTLGMVSGLSVAFLYRHLQGNLDVVVYGDDVLPDRPDVVPVEGPKKPLNILVMGSDSRDCEGCGIDQEGGGGSDTTILFHLSADRQSAYGISIPRDSLVERPECISEDGDTIPGGTDAMWNEAFSYGGPSCTINQFETITGIRLTNYIVVDFGSFKSMVDAIDGVEVCVPEDIDDQAHGITIKKGTRTLNGNEALSYVRVRHGVGDGSDIGRIKRQQAFIASMVSRVVSAGVLARPDRLIGFLNAATKSLKTDISSIKDIADVGRQFQDIGLKRIRFITVPFEYEGARVRWTSDADILWDRILHDKPLGKLRVGSIGADQAPTGGPSSTSSESPSDDPSSSTSETPSETSSEGSSDDPSSPSDTASPSDDSSESVDASAGDLAFAGLCT